VGLNLAEQLLARGESVMLYDLNAPPPVALHDFAKLSGKLTAVQGDTTNREKLAEIFQQHRIERIIHTAAITANTERDARDPRRIAEVNLIGTLNVLEAARDHGVR